MNENLDKIEKLKSLKKKLAIGQIESEIFCDLNTPNEKDINAGAESQDIKNKQTPEQSSKRAFNYALRILAQRDYSIYKMTAKLKSRGFRPEEVKDTIDKLHSFNYLREEEYTKGRVKQLIVKGYANSFIIQKLEQEELYADQTLIDSIRSSQDLGSDSQIIYLIDKKLRGKEIPTDFSSKMKLKDKITRFLLSKGFSFSEIGNHLNEKFK